jgi:hypothetical protein
MIYRLPDAHPFISIFENSNTTILFLNNSAPEYGRIHPARFLRISLAGKTEDGTTVLAVKR